MRLAAAAMERIWNQAADPDDLLCVEVPGLVYSAVTFHTHSGGRWL